MINHRTVREAYERGKNTLSRAGLESPAFDALCLLKEAFGIGDRAALAIHGSEPADPEKTELFGELIIRRTREPLQYILGRWEFDGMPLSVGEGVLIPREDTMTLVETACSWLNGKQSPKILDLCAGSGAVGLAIGRRIPDAEVICVEKSPEALPYLRRNIDAFGDGRVTVRQADVLLPPDFTREHETFDAIVSNPPYIPRDDIAGLAWEVQREPLMALDGGNDGLDFYRAICTLWKPAVRDGGLIAFEIGYDIREGVIDIMKKNSIGQINAVKDFNGVDRCIFGTAVS
jgi:protein-(glutamine-N5) methyltransferase, release factor-specific